MRKFISFALSALILAGTFVSCTNAPDTGISLASSGASEAAEWLTEKLGHAPEGIVMGIGSSSEYGVDMTDFESDGYIIRTIGDTTVIFGKTAEGLDKAARKYAKVVVAGNAATFDETFHEGYRIKRLTIAGRDISEYTLYYPENANENMKFAASELVRLVKKATGADLPVVVGEPVLPAIEFRHSDDAALKNDGYRYFVTDDGLVIEGAVDRGCMNGVWRFLQNECGWDCLIYGDSYLNESDHVDVPVGTEATETPAFEFLNIYNPYNTFKNDHTIPTPAQNSYGTVTHACHGLQNNRFCEDTDFGKQPCFTSEEVYEVCRDNVEKYVAANYGNPDFKEVDIAQYDTSSYCLCETCMEVYVEEGGNAGAVVRFANRLQEEMEEKYPGIVYKIFGYAGTNVPPKVTVPNDLIYVTFCFDHNCSNHKADGSECTDKVNVNNRNNSDYAKWFEGWCDITDNVYIWPYTLGTALQSYTVLDNIYDDYRYFADNDVRGIMLETEDCGGFSVKRIEHQLIAELNWNMDMSREEFESLKETLLEREYGDGWEYIDEYIDQWNLSQDMTGNCWQCWGWNQHGTWADKRYETGFYKDRFDHFVDLMEAAVASANSASQEDHVMRLYASVLYKGCYSSYYFEYLKGNTERIAVLSERYDKCMAIVRDLGYDPANLPTISGGEYAISYAPTLEEAAWIDWVDWFDDVTGQPLPDDAPVREP